MQGPEFLSGGERRYDNVLGGHMVGALDGGAGKIAERKNLGSGANGAVHRPTQLKRAERREKFRVFQKADVVDADHRRNRTGQWRGVLDVQQVRPILAQSARKV